MVGDDLQAIYGFRAASAGHILGFGEHFPDARDRDARAATAPRRPSSTRRRAGAEAKRRYPRALRSAREGGRARGSCSAATRQAQAAHVATRVLDAREQGMLLREQAVLDARRRTTRRCWSSSSAAGASRS